MKDKNGADIAEGDFIKFTFAKGEAAQIGRVFDTTPHREPKRTNAGEMVAILNDKKLPTGEFEHSEHECLKVLHFVGNASEVSHIDADTCEVVLKANSK